MLNKWQGIGNLTRDPEARTSGSGLTVCNLSVACNTRRNVGGEWQDVPEYVRVVTFAKLADNVAKFLQKGRQVYVEGEMRTNKWQDKDGNDRWTTEIVANEVKFLGSAKSEAGGGYGNGPSRGNAVADDDIPF